MRAGIWLSILLACGDCAFALDPSLDLSQYAHTSWKVREGFTSGTIFAMAQTPDGYLWLGTESGLVRFDGVRAVPWQSPNGEQLPSILSRNFWLRATELFGSARTRDWPVGKTAR